LFVVASQALDGLADDGETAFDGWQIFGIDTRDDLGQYVAADAGQALQDIDALAGGAQALNAAVNLILVAGDVAVLDEPIDDAGHRGRSNAEVSGEVAAAAAGGARARDYPEGAELWQGQWQLVPGAGLCEWGEAQGMAEAGVSVDSLDHALGRARWVVVG